MRKDEQWRGEGWEKGILMKKRRLEERKSNKQEKDERKDAQWTEQDLDKVRLMNRGRMGERMINEENKIWRKYDQ